MISFIFTVRVILKCSVTKVFVFHNIIFHDDNFFCFHNAIFHHEKSLSTKKDHGQLCDWLSTHSDEVISFSLCGNNQDETTHHNEFFFFNELD